MRPSSTIAIAALAVSAFAIGTTEFVIMGLLPQLAADFAVSVPGAGLLVTGYALGVAIGAPLLAALTGRVPRKTLLLALMALFTLGNILCATAPSYTLMMAARVVTSFAHGSFFGVGSVVAAGLVAQDKRAGAVALMFTGLTIANILGVPFGKLLGDVYGWRSTFWAISGLGVIAMAAVALLVPRIARVEDSNFLKELRVAMKPPVLLALATTVFGFAGVFAAFTYVAPLLLDVTGTTQGMVTAALVLFGIGVTIGNMLGGKVADYSLMPGLMGILALLILVLVAQYVFATQLWPTLALVTLVGVFGFATVPGLQTRVLDKASDAAALAATLNIGAFNLGNAIGAWVGAVVIEQGFGIAATALGGAALATIGLVATAMGHMGDRAESRTALAAAE
ncbi:MFS transporter [Ferrovibrio terrae]|uniref:MFS transporter n=1 Tax=Ferrovibrio terrae TaxID=2594003 RepID=A0A516GYZ9_9PROT|nr:MFS transporter [Ferrovibrio terrae]QDO96763.1 MFS transporter [Ferrovibrio terrae]